MLSALTLAVLLAATLSAPAGAQSSAQSAVLSATLELPDGSVEHPLELGTLHFFEQGGAPFVVQVIDGCAVNGHLWVFGATFAAQAAPIKVLDATSGLSHTALLPAYAPGEPVEPLFDAQAIAACEGASLGGLPELVGTASYVPVSGSCSGFVDPFALRSEGSDDAYRTFVRRGTERNRIVGGRTIAAIDESGDWDELHLMAESRTPRRIEGVVFSGSQGMLPARLQDGLKSLRYARVRRAFEAAKNGRSPRSLINDLRLDGVDCIHHVTLDFSTPGAPPRLEAAGWIRDGGIDPGPPPLVEDRFRVEIVQADGTATSLPLVGPVAGSAGAGRLWRYQDEAASAQIIDACDLTGTLWSLGVAVTDVPVELRVTDTLTEASSLQVLWGEDGRPAASADTSMEGCG